MTQGDIKLERLYHHLQLRGSHIKISLTYFKITLTLGELCSKFALDINKGLEFLSGIILKTSNSMKKDYRFLAVDYRLLQKTDLNPIDKQVFSFIRGLVEGKKTVQACNATLGTIFGVSNATISRTITKLNDKGFIRCHYQDGNRREIFIDEDHWTTINKYLETDEQSQPISQEVVSTPTVEADKVSVHNSVNSEKLAPCDFTMNNFDPARMVLRYIPQDAFYHKFVNNLRPFWIANSEDYGLVEFVKLLFQYRDESKEIPMINLVNQILNGINADNDKSQQQKSVGGES